MANTYLRRSISSAGSQTKWCASAWVKRCELGLSGGVYCSSDSSTNQNTRGIFFSAVDTIECGFYNGGWVYEVETNRKFRDLSAWYHIVIAMDTTQATASDRVKIWVNGVQETSMSVTNYPSQNSTHNFFGTDIYQLIGNLREGSAIHHSCIISHVHVTDGYTYQASDFGEFDANGVWTIKTSPSVTYGTNGFFILKDGNSVTDQSGNGNNFTVAGGTLTNTEDSPSNVFATLNPLDTTIVGTTATFAYGNTQWTSSGNSTSNNGTRMTLGASSGKYYFEAKLLEATLTRIGVHLDSVNPIYDSNGYIGNNSGYYAIYIDNSDNIYAIVAGSNQNVNLGSVTNNDIIGCAFDFDNNKFYFSKNGTWLNSGDPTSGATGTGSFGTLASGLYIPAVTNVSWDVTSSTAFNFGNGYFGTTAVASAGTNASGNGIFEYDVPTGYTALSTKGLNL